MFDKKELIVSCQIGSHHDMWSDVVLWMVSEAVSSNIKTVRLCGVDNVAAVKKEYPDVKIIGCTKGRYDNGNVFITPTVEDAVKLFEAGADYVAADFTLRYHRQKQELDEMCKEGPVIADISTLQEGCFAAKEFDVCAIATTLSGYTEASKTDNYVRRYEPDLYLPGLIAFYMRADKIDMPVIAEGRYWMPEQVNFAFKSGASAVCLGAVVTKPNKIIDYFNDMMDL